MHEYTSHLLLACFFFEEGHVVSKLSKILAIWRTLLALNNHRPLFPIKQ